MSAAVSPLLTPPPLPSKWLLTDEDRARLFMRTWLPLVVPGAEYQQLRLMSPVLVQEMFPDVWRLGPQAGLWRARRPKLIEVLNACMDNRLSATEVLRFQHAYHDIFWVQHWHQSTIRGFMERYRQQGLPDRILSEDGFWQHPFWSSPGMAALWATDAYFPNHYTPAWQRGDVLRFTLGEHILQELAARSKSKTAAQMLVTHDVFWAEIDRLYALAVLERE